ncbi:GIY-YIG nuclease family protein [Candidatus Woesebacteria bacterium]|nr:MAG: GIY-YIG nuclease family protein [Candidatus Woesebacteria bacterium]
MTYFVYILRTSSNTLYIGQTNDVRRRISEHKKKGKKSAKYLRYFKSVELIHQEKYNTKSQALKREAELKKWPKAKKEELCKNRIHEVLSNNEKDLS